MKLLIEPKLQFGIEFYEASIMDKLTGEIVLTSTHMSREYCIVWFYNHRNRVKRLCDEAR